MYYILFYFILFYFILFILFYFISLFYFILYYIEDADARPPHLKRNLCVGVAQCRCCFFAGLCNSCQDSGRMFFAENNKRKLKTYQKLNQKIIKNPPENSKTTQHRSKMSKNRSKRRFGAQEAHFQAPESDFLCFLIFG